MKEKRFEGCGGLHGNNQVKHNKNMQCVDTLKVHRLKEQTILQYEIGDSDDESYHLSKVS